MTIIVPGAPDFTPHVEGLLKETGMSTNRNIRSHLETELKFAWVDYQLERDSKRGRVPRNLFNQLKNSIRTTQRLLRTLEGVQGFHKIGLDMCLVGKGTVNTETAQSMIRGKGLKLVPGNRSGETSVAIINRKDVLDRLRREIVRYARKKGRQPGPHKALIVARAACFFKENSNEKQTTHFDGPFVTFCRSFYEVATGETLSSSGLEKAIRKEVTTRRT
jgi:hypothetical protein